MASPSYPNQNPESGDTSSRLREMNLNNAPELQAGQPMNALEGINAATASFTSTSDGGYAGFPPAAGQTEGEPGVPMIRPSGDSASSGQSPLIDKYRQQGSQQTYSQPIGPSGPGYGGQPSQGSQQTYSQPIGPSGPGYGGQPSQQSQGYTNSQGRQPQHGDQDYEWVADLLAKMWPYVTDAVNKEAKAQLPGLIKASKPTWMGDIAMHKIELGGAPPRLTDIRVVMNEGSKGLKGDDYIHLEMDFDWDSRQDVEIDVSPLPDQMSFVPGFVSKALSKATSFRCGVENFEMFGKILISFRPLMHQIPIVGAIQVSFTEAPDFDFDVTLGGGETKVLEMIPALKGFLYGFISDTLLGPYIMPDHYFYPMDPKAPDLQIPVGYVEVEVIEAKNVPKMDLIGATDAYVEVMTHKRGVQKTEIATGKSPSWNKSYKMPIMVPRYQQLTLIMWDSDTGGDDEIGRAKYAIRDLQTNKTEDLWLPIRPLMSQDKEEKNEGQGGEKPKESKGSRIRKALSKPVGPPDPESKHTEIHIRLTYKELAEDQVRSVLEAEQNRTPIRDAFMRELLKEDSPTGTVAGDHAQQSNAVPTTDQEAKDASSAYPITRVDAQGCEMVEVRARPVSSDPEIARLGEESGQHSRGPP